MRDYVDYVIDPPELPSMAVEGETRRFPIGRVFCIGRNYPWPNSAPVGHAADREPPVYFMKPADAVVPAEGFVAYPPLTQDFCHEIELVVAMGDGGSQIAPNDALAHVWGYAVGLDLTRRDLQAQAKQAGQPWEGAKAFDASAPVGPLVPVVKSGHPLTGALWLKVNGVERQRADLADLIWPVNDLISQLSHSVQLKRGDLVFTGTPFGVAALFPGDVVSGGVEGLGQFTFTVSSSATSMPALREV